MGPFDSLKRGNLNSFTLNLLTCWQAVSARGHAFSWIRNFPDILDSGSCLPRIQMDFFQLLEPYAVNTWHDRKWEYKGIES